MEEKVIFKLIKQLSRALDSHRNKIFEKYDLTSSQIDVLIYLFMDNEKEINQKDIENFLSLSNPTVTGILSRLEKKYFIKREISAEDKRHKEIILTKKSLDIKEKVVNSMEDDTRTLFYKIMKEEKIALQNLLLKLLDNIER